MMRPRVAGRRPVALAVLLTVAAPFVAYAAVRTAAHEATNFRTDFHGALPPPSPWVEVREIMKTARQPRQPVPAEARDLAARAAGAYPLSFEPFFIAARVEESSGRYQEATRLMEEARRRRPNYIPTRVQLLSYYSLANAYQQAIDEADLAMQVNPNTATYILPAFAKLVAADPKARAAIAKALARDPTWDTAFFETASKSGMKPEDAAALLADIRRGGAGGDRRAQEGFLVSSLVAAGRFGEARDQWRRTLASGADAGATVVDRTFATGAQPPFGWSLAADVEGVAERARATAGEPSHLSVSYFGGAPATLAEQLLVLKPGSYRLSTRARVEGLAEGASLNWTLSCDGGAALATLPLAGSADVRTSAVGFTVPAGCASQRLRLAGAPAYLPRTVTAQIYEVNVAPGGGGGGAR